MSTDDHQDATVQEMTVVEMVETGMDWRDIAKALDTNVDVAMQRYRDQAYDHWDTGWELGTADGMAHVTTGVVDIWADDDATVRIEEVYETIPLTIVIDDNEVQTVADAGLNAEQARALAATLEECADILEENDA